MATSGRSPRAVDPNPNSMNIVSTIARLLLGLMFLVFGLNGFLHFIPSPQPTGMWGAFFTLLSTSHYAYMVFGVQAIAGILLLTNQYVPLAIVTLAAVLANILTFHITMMPSGLPPALLATLLWFLTAWPIRAHFAPILSRSTG